MISYIDIIRWKDLVDICVVDVIDSEDVSLEGLEQELQECKDDEVSYSMFCLFSFFLRELKRLLPLSTHDNL